MEDWIVPGRVDHSLGGQTQTDQAKPGIVASAPLPLTCSNNLEIRVERILLF